MASIILGPGEQFEHQHAQESETVLRRGKVRISIGGQQEERAVGESAGESSGKYFSSAAQ